MISDEAYRDFQEAIGDENVSREPAVLDGYAWQPNLNDDPMNFITRPEAVVLPGSTEDVQLIVRLCNKHGLKFKAFSTGWGCVSGPTSEGVVQIDLRRMDRILEIDEKNMYAVVEPYVSGAQLQAEAMKVGLNTHIIGAGPNCSPLASATSGWGVGHDGAYMSYSPRNVLGVEWVLPTGEVLKLGTPGSNMGWFCGDGPGPSLRGIMRGFVGAFSGMGVFTKVALKLFNWPGPSFVKTKGMMLDAQSEVPDNFKIFFCYFPDSKRFADACYQIGEAELGYNSLRLSTAGMVDVVAPHLFEKIAETKNLKRIISETMKYPYIMILAGSSSHDIEYQVKALKKIMDDTDGFCMDITKMKPAGGMIFMAFIRATLPAMVFRRGGAFATALSRNEALDSQVEWAEAVSDLKQSYIEKGSILDDLGDNPYFVTYEDNMWCHCEVIYQYDPRGENNKEKLGPIVADCVVAAIERRMEPGFGMFPAFRGILSPLSSNFNKWQKKTSQVFDPDQVADKGFFTDEFDYDIDTLEPESRSKLEKLRSSLKWTDSGPPGEKERP